MSLHPLILREIEHYGSSFVLEDDKLRPHAISYQALLHRRQAPYLCCYGRTPAEALEKLTLALTRTQTAA